jgi:SAM-dependent methyltransferase
MAFSVIRDFYNRPPLHATESTFRKIKTILPLFEAGKGGCFLDIACHDGEKTIAIQRQLAARLTVGIDFEGGALDFARGRGIPCVAVDLNQNTPLPFPNASFDYIHAGEIIEHLFSPDLLLKEIARLLKPSGYAVISTPNLASWRNKLVLLLGWQPFDTEVSTVHIVGNPRASRGVMSGHIRVFTLKALRELVGLYGLSIRKVVGFPIGQPNSFLTYVTAVIDSVGQAFFPTMCDSVIIKFDKGDAHRHEGSSGG